MKAGSVAASLLKISRLPDTWNFGEPHLASIAKLLHLLEPSDRVHILLINNFGETLRNSAQLVIRHPHEEQQS
jgi:hypothetical protein